MALGAVDFPPLAMPRFEEAFVARAIERISADDRLFQLFARADDDAIRRTFFSVYYGLRVVIA